MTDLINAALGERVVRAAADARDVYAALPSSTYVSRQEVLEYEENDAGWPSIVRSSRDSSKAEAPLDWHSTLGVTKSKTFYKLDVSDVPTLPGLIAFVLEDPETVPKISATSVHAKNEQRAKDTVASDVVRLVGTVLNRAEALDDTSDARLLEIYAELEPGLLAPELAADLLFPIALRRLETDRLVELTPDIVIEPLSRETQLARAVTVSGSSEVNPYLVAAATHAIVLKNQKLDNSNGPLTRLLRLHYAPPGTADADLVCEALTIASGLDVGYAQVCLRPHGWADDTWKLNLPAVTSIATLPRYPLRLNDRGWAEAQDSIGAEALDRLPAIYAALKATDRRAQLASRRLAQTSRRERTDDTIIDACIGIEALLGEQHSELVHRMGLRGATALSAIGWDAAIAYDVLKKVYDFRSTIVHGGVPKKQTIDIEGKPYSASATAVYLLRELLNAHLSSTPPWTPSSLDKELFKVLAERQAARTAGSGADTTAENLTSEASEEQQRSE